MSDEELLVRASELAMRPDWDQQEIGQVVTIFPHLLALARLGAAVEGMPVIAIYNLDTGGNGHLDVTPWYPVDSSRLSEIKDKLEKLSHVLDKQRSAALGDNFD